VRTRAANYPSDLTEDQWELLEPVFNAPGKRGRKHANDLRTVVDAMLYIAQTGCQWRYLPQSFGPWTRVWSQFRPLEVLRVGAADERRADPGGL
jgi:putative transposase